MWKLGKPTNNYKAPTKPETIDEQVSMLWDEMCNHWPALLLALQQRQNTQDIKTGFVLTLLAIMMGFSAVQAFT